MNYSKIKHISFDLWMTLIKSHPQYKGARVTAIYQFIKNKFGVNIDGKTITEVVTDVEKGCDFSNEITGGQISQFTCYLAIMEKLHLDTDGMHMSDFKELNDSLFSLLQLYPPSIIGGDYTLDCLKQLRDSGITMNIASNTSFITGKEMDLAFMDAYFGDIFKFKVYSDELGFSKLSLHFYDAVLNQVEDSVGMLSKSEILHIGDNKHTDGASSKFGFTFIHTNNISETLQLLTTQLCTHKHTYEQQQA